MSSSDDEEVVMLDSEISEAMVNIEASYVMDQRERKRKKVSRRKRFVRKKNRGTYQRKQGEWEKSSELVSIIPVMLMLVIAYLDPDYYCDPPFFSDCLR